jgi:hypothetical protein
VRWVSPMHRRPASESRNSILKNCPLSSSPPAPQNLKFERADWSVFRTVDGLRTLGCYCRRNRTWERRRKAAVANHVKPKDRRQHGLRPTVCSVIKERNPPLQATTCSFGSESANPAFMKPRCRWHVDAGDGLELEPYRLLVSLIENRRVDGKVRQEHVADLGAIDGHLLPAFYAGIDPAVVETITTEVDWPPVNVVRSGTVFNCRSWRRASLEMRIEFWQALHETLSRLSSRIDAIAAGKILEAVNARIPMPTIDKLEQVPLQRAEEGLASAKDSHASSLHLVEGNKKVAAAAERQAALWQQDAELRAQEIAAWQTKMEQLRGSNDPLGIRAEIDDRES